MIRLRSDRDAAGVKSAAPPIDYDDEDLHPYVREAVIQMSAWNSWFRVMRDHRRGSHGWCSGHSVETPWPCVGWQIADAGRRMHEARFVPAPGFGGRA